VRVIASDGFHSAVDSSHRGFTLPKHPPEVRITGYNPSLCYRPDEAIMLEGKAIDAEDFCVDAATLRWSVSYLGHVADGPGLYLDDMPPGKYTITLHASDADGQTDRDSIEILVGYQAMLPMITKAGR